MAKLPTSSSELSPDGPVQPWYKEVTWYHWLVVIIASAGWLFDCMDQRIFILAREPALRELLGDVSDKMVKDWSGWATAMMMIGWATGGIIFGMTSDRLGRVKTMVITLLIYSGFTGLSGMSRTGTEFIIYRFLVGLGVGGMFGAATTLVAESVPSRFRVLALGSLQALSAMGNIIGSLLSIWIQPGKDNFIGNYSGWRVIFFVGILPAILVIPIMLILREPEVWKEAKRKVKEGTDPSKHIGSIPDLFRDSVLRRNLLVGVALGLAGMAGLWGIGFFSPELISAALEGKSQEVIDVVKGRATALQDVGAFFGMMTFTFVAAFVGRKPAFFGAFILCLVTTIFVFNYLETEMDAYWMLPIMGFAHLSVFGGYSIYFPELFPTRLRGTGVGFCYNTVRYLAAGFPPALMYLRTAMETHGVDDPFRKAATALSFIFALGLFALIWAPETKGQPLPE
ncbi:MAG: MFS transporter [Candidatus Nealsonbacteria bacterium]|nr:MFS transporter [Candidatus Nealsonbacteria bacterium]